MIKDFLIKNRGTESVSFHMPGHKGENFFRKYGQGDFLEGLAGLDTTEIPGADNLHHPQGIIKDLMKAYAEDYSSDYSFLLVNGSSCGIIAAVLAAVPQGKKLLMARNCHRSVYSALTLGNIDPVFIPVGEYGNEGIMGGIEVEAVEKVLDGREDIGAVILPSPNYYGITSPIDKIVDVVHGKNLPLIVDQAHGAHLHFFDKFFPGFLPKSAENQGADIIINSIHKTLASFTQSGILNIRGGLTDPAAVMEKLALVESSSPSYLLMASLDVSRDIIHRRGERIFAEWKGNLERFYDRTEKLLGIKLITGSDLDRTKINIDCSALNITGAELQRKLVKREIVPELYTGNILMCMMGIGNERKDYERLSEALEEISGEVGVRRDNASSSPGRKFLLPELCIRADRELWTGKGKEYVTLEESTGRISSSAVIPYPPGIPFISEGEIISQEVVTMLSELSREGNDIVGLEKNYLLCYKENIVD